MSKSVVLTRWSITVRDWLGSETLRGLSAEAECLFLRLCLDQWEHGAARHDKEFWRRAHAHRTLQFDGAWQQASSLFTLTPDGLVHARVKADRERAEAEIRAKVDAAARTNKARSQRAKVGSDAKRALSVRSSDAERALMPPSASASASASVEEPTPTPPEEGLFDDHPEGFNRKPDKPKTKQRASKPEPDIPASLDTPQVRQALSDYHAARREQKRKPLGNTGLTALYAKLAEWGPTNAEEALRNSVANGWQGVFEPVSANGTGKPINGHSVVAQKPLYRDL